MSRAGRLRIRQSLPQIAQIVPTSNEEALFEGIVPLLTGKEPEKKVLSKGLVQLERAPNSVIFFESEKFLAGPELFPFQYIALRDFFELLCPYCNDIKRIQSKDDVPRDEQILFEHDICPVCGLNKVDIKDELKNYNELMGILGMRSGKGVLVAGIAAYIVHECLCIDDLQEKLGVVKRQAIDGSFVAAAGQQAAETVWGHFRGFYEESPWFQNYKKALMDLEVTDPRFRRGMLYRESDRLIWWQDRNIRLRALTSNSASSAGKTSIFTSIDELSRLDAGASKRSATEIYRAFKRSLTTIRVAVAGLREKGIINIPDAKMLCISSPLFADDKSMQLLQQANQQQRLFAFKRATWEANPNITKEDLADEFEADEVGAERDYGANPPGAENPLIKDQKIIELCTDKLRKSMFIPKEIFFDQEVQGVKFHYMKLDIGNNLKFNNLTEYVIHCDPGKTQDSFCVAIGHWDRETNFVIIDGALEYRPIPKNNRLGMAPAIVHFPSITKMIINLSNMLSLKVVTYDRWNSEEQIQSLRDANILAIGKNINRDDHLRLLRTMESGKIRFPAREVQDLNPALIRNVPCSKALWELSRLNDNGMKVDHPANGSSDMVQCYVGIHRILATPEEIFSKQELKNQQQVQNVRQMRKHTRGVGRVIHMNRPI